MKKEYNYLDELTDKSSKFRVKVKVIEKARPHQSPGKKKIQRLTLQDDKGNTMKGTIFDTDIPTFEQAIVRNGEYEIEDAVIQKLPDSAKKDWTPFQMNFNPNIRITPLNAGPEVGNPRYTKLSAIPRTQGPNQELIDIIVVVLYVEKIREVGVGSSTQNVREIVVTDNSNSTPRTLVVSAWNDFAYFDVERIVSVTDALPIIGITALRKTVHKGFSVASTMSSEIILEPAGEDVDVLKDWATNNASSLIQLQQQVIQARAETGEHTPTPIVTINAKKATNTLQEEKHWIRVTIPNLAADDLFLYIGCSNCGRKGDANIGELYKCTKCNQDETKGVPRAALKVDVFDSTSTRQFTLFSKDIESLFQTTMDELYTWYTAVDKSILCDAIDKIRTSPFLFQIRPTVALNRSNLMAWAVKEIKLA